MRFVLKHAALAAACMAAFPAYATNGYFLPGFGNRSQGMGGVGIAYGRDSLSTAANPANAVNTGMRGDMGFAVFNPERHAAVGADAGQANPAFGFSGSVESDKKYFVMPEMGFSMPLDDRLHVALAVVGNGGMNTTYRENFFSMFGSVPPKDTTIGVDLMQVLIPVSAAYKVNEDHAFGASLVLAETRFRAYGLDAFVLAGISSDPAHLTNQGYDYSYGAGVKVGWLGEFLGDKLTVGATYASRTWMSKFDKYAGLFAEQGDFDIPENYGVGVAIKPSKNLVIAADVLRINFSDVASVGNRGPGLPYGVLGVPAFFDLSTRLGLDGGMGFGWEDQTVYKLGVQYGVNKRLQLRAGYNYGKSPIPNDQLAFNTLAPATVERHYSLGFTYKANDNLEVTGTYLHAASNVQAAVDQNIIGGAQIDMHQNMFGLSLGWVLDPGPGATEEYGDGDWAGINFDRWYAGVGFGQSHYNDFDADSSDPDSLGWKAFGGYQFNDYLALEAGYANFNDMSAVTGTVKTNVVTDTWTLGAVLSYPITDKFALLGRLGVARMSANIKTKDGLALTEYAEEDSYEPNYGVGVRYALFDNMDLRAEWERFDASDLNVDMISAGFAVKF